MLCDVCSAGIGTIGQRERLIHGWFPISFFHLRGERQAHAVRRDKDHEANARSALRWRRGDRAGMLYSRFSAEPIRSGRGD